VVVILPDAARRKVGGPEADPSQGRPPAASLAVHDFATLTEREARQLGGRPALFCVVLDGEPDGDEEHGWRYECRGEGEPLRSLWLPDGDDLVAAEAAKGSGLLLVVATLRRIVPRPVVGGDGRPLPALVEYRLVRARVVDRAD
jgi:hypothetical protein